MTTLREEVYDKVNEIWDIGKNQKGINLTGYTLAIIELFEILIDSKFLKYEKETPFLGDEDIQKDVIDFVLAELKEELKK